jgi:TATA-box binding protein (TBP) (component of TFIID and TFIIIB)
VQRVTEREEPLKIDNFRVVMINTNFSMNSSVNLMKVIEVLAAENKFDVEYNPLEIERLPTNPLTENDRFIVSFNPERYSAVKVKFHPAANTKQVTASIFSTGKIIVTGAETLREIALAYEVLNEKLQSTKLEATKEDTFDVIKGNKFDDIVSKLRQEGVVRF